MAYGRNSWKLILVDNLSRFFLGRDICGYSWIFIDIRMMLRGWFVGSEIGWKYGGWLWILNGYYWILGY